ncbi:MAG: hypothetical protein H6765_00330 [Candidatus Peribacteria bacterium]|nr:MAG: hypothetical protein H6765_00330 [Candidatus Peribacteria bacterium]
MTPKADRYRDAIQAVVEDEADVDMILVILTPQVMTEIEETAQVIAELSKTHRLPIVCAFIGEEHVHAGHKVLYQYNIPCFSYPTNAIRVLSKAYKRYTYTQQDQGTELITAENKQIFAGESGAVQDTRLESLLTAHGISVPPSQTVHSLEEALSRASQT